MAIEKGKLVRWIDEKGFGFIKPENGKNDLFIHISAIKSNRKPIIGDIILYETSIDTKGKQHAINAIIEGVSQPLVLSSLEKQGKKAHPPIAKAGSHKHNNPSVNKPKNIRNLLLFLIFSGLAIFVYYNISKEKRFIDQTKTPAVEVASIEHAETFTCQGKI
jgi:cold shock CspA family protein